MKANRTSPFHSFLSFHILSFSLAIFLVFSLSSFIIAVFMHKCWGQHLSIAILQGIYFLYVLELNLFCLSCAITYSKLPLLEG